MSPVKSLGGFGNKDFMNVRLARKILKKVLIKNSKVRKNQRVDTECLSCEFTTTASSFTEDIVH